MNFPVFSEYSVSPLGVSTLISEPHPSSGGIPEIIPDLIPLVLEHLPLLKLIELAELETSDPSAYHNLIYRLLRRTAIRQIVMWPEESEGLIYIDVSIFGREGVTIDIEGENYRITQETYSRAFDYLLKIVTLTNCARASLTVEPKFYPAGLETVSLPFRARCNGLIPVREVIWAIGAPLELIVQLHPVKLLIDTSLHGRIDGIAEIQQRIRDSNIHAV